MSRRIVVEFLGKDKSLGKTVDQVDGKTSTLGSKMAKIGKVAAAALAAGAIVGGKALFDMGQKAGDLNETISKTNQIFGDAAGKSLEKWAKGAATSLGQSQQTALDAASTFGVFGKSAGKSGMELARFAKQNTQLATDLASFHNTSPEEAIEALGAAFRGEAEPMRKYGVLLDDASMRQQALKMGLVKTTKEALTPQQKVLAAQALIMKQTGDAQGDFARTSGGLANQQRILKAQFDNLQTSVGKAVLPVLLKLALFANNTLIPALKRMGEWIQANVLPALRSMGDFVKTRILPVLQRFGSDGPGAMDKVRVAVAPVVAAYKGLFKTVAPIVKQIVAVIRSNWGPITAWAKRTFGQVKSIVSGVFQVLTAIVKRVTQLIKAIWSRWGGDILAVATRYFRAVGQVVSGALRVVQGVIKTVLSVIRGDWRGAWAGIKMILSGAWQAMRAVVSLAWDGIKAAISRGISAATGLVKSLPSKIKAALGNLGSLLLSAGAAIIQGLIDGVQSKIGALTSKLGEVTRLIPKFKGPLDKDKILLKPAGVAIMEGLIRAIDSKKHDLGKVLGSVTDFVKRAGDKLRGLMSDRRSFAGGFQSFTSSVFGADLGMEPDADGNMPKVQGVGAMLAFQKEQQAKAERLRRNVRQLLKKGLSADLVRQLQASGESGIEQINALAGASKSQLRQVNQANAATNSALRGAGMQAADSLYAADIREAKRAQQTAKAIRSELRQLLKEQKEGMVIQLTLDGRTLRASLLKEKRRNGGAALGLA
jgi:hypothetical protein